MSASFAKLEKTVFRSINSLVEPAVRKGIASSRLTPASLIVLETLGFKSGQQRRTPLWSFRLGKYRIVSTARGDRSFWVKNIVKQPRVSYYVGGKRRESNALVIAGSLTKKQLLELSPIMRKLCTLLANYAQSGWTFAVLMPVKA